MATRKSRLKTNFCTHMMSAGIGADSSSAYTELVYEFTLAQEVESGDLHEENMQALPQGGSCHTQIARLRAGKPNAHTACVHKSKFVLKAQADTPLCRHDANQQFAEISPVFGHSCYTCDSFQAFLSSGQEAFRSSHRPTTRTLSATV